MNILKISYVTADQTEIEITSEQGLTRLAWPCSTWLGDAVERWIEQGGEIIPYQAVVASADEIKAEAARRIEKVLPDWKQRNLTARAAELAMKGQLTSEEQAEWNAGEIIWDWIKLVRARSDELESDPPEDVTQDSIWPDFNSEI